MEIPIEIVDQIIMAQRPNYDYLDEIEQLFEAKEYYDELKENIPWMGKVNYFWLIKNKPKNTMDIFRSEFDEYDSDDNQNPLD